MNFEDYCQQIAEDKQKVTARSDTLVNFTNSKGQFFQITPEVIVNFLEFCKKNWDDVQQAWESVEQRRDKINLYEEKSYRAIYRLADGKQNIEVISSLGRSQTKPLAKLIGKIIAFVLDEKYIDANKDSFFDFDRLNNFLLVTSNKNLQNLITDKPKSSKLSDINHKTFQSWLIHSENLSESTARKYSVDVPKRVDSLLADSKFYSKNFYSFRTSTDVEKLRAFLKENADWQSHNNNGHSMYNSALSKYKSFISSSTVSLTSLPKPFILLAGISGTGKTRFVREQAKVTSHGNKNYEIAPVRPDWHEPSDLLGYISRLGEQPEYVPTKVLSFIAQAWAHLDPAVEIDESGRAWWVVQNSDNACPYWLCLDEMNLAPVEQYFADYLSVLETREFDHSSSALKYRSDALVSADLINGLEAEAARNLQKALDVSDSLFEQFKEHGIPLPFNLIIAGTVNMDETTHGFSRKVIDRALTIDFGLFFENRFEEFFDAQPNIQPFTFSTVADAREPGLFDDNEDFRDQSIEFLTQVNSVLKGTPFELAFRALNELLLSVHCFNPTSEIELAAVWDDFLMTKVLPRIEGDSDKLSLPEADSTSSNNVLSALETVLEGNSAFNQIIAGKRHDFFRTDSNADAIKVSCRSIDTIERMQSRLGTNGYTSFWP